ncbi:MAG: hypothetical protein JSW47_02480 [Phycisphaerales bacterium]|nr:MAG: hypothetical protein JSW47_02480 [Phycisphaerales bacterium]
MNTAQADPSAGRTERKRDTVSLCMLILLASAIGVYLIATTVLISKDGVLYIERAQKLASRAADANRTDAPGYSFLIIASHKVAEAFGGVSSLLTWIYPAQITNLLSRLFALIPLYFIGKMLVGGKKSFYAMLILILLPRPAKVACELSREWPYMLFLATGFLLLLWGARRGVWWTFGPAGLIAGLGYWIHQECVLMGNYGQAGAIWVLGEKHNLPKSISGYLQYCFWGPRGPSGEVAISMGIDVEILKNHFGSVKKTRIHWCRWSIPYEKLLDVYVCREPRKTLAEMWPSFKHLD